MAETRLTEGAITGLATGELSRGSKVHPVLQIMGVRLLSREDGIERFEVRLSDGIFTLQALLSIHYNNHVQSGALRRASIIKLSHFSCVSFHNHMIVSLHDIETVTDNRDIIGNPMPYPYNVVDENTPFLGGGLSQAMNQRAAGSFVPSFGGSSVTDSVPSPNVNGIPYNSSAMPTTYQKTEYGSVVSEAPPTNSYIRSYGSLHALVILLLVVFILLLVIRLSQQGGPL